MEFVERMFDGVHNVFQLNPATLSGAIDIIVVKHPDGTYHCTPFHVRFGKLQLLRSRDKVVTITVNDQPVKLKMKLGDAGEAFFVAESEHGPAHPMFVTSPLSSPPESPRSRSPFTSPTSSPFGSRRERSQSEIIPSRTATQPLDATAPAIAKALESIKESTPSMNRLATISEQSTPSDRNDEISNLELDSFEFHMEGGPQAQTSKQWSWGWGRLPTWRKGNNAVTYPTDVVSTPSTDKKSDKPADVEAGELDSKSTTTPSNVADGKENISNGKPSPNTNTPPPGWKSKVGSFFRILKRNEPQEKRVSLPGAESQDTIDLDEDSYSDSDFEDTYSEFEDLTGSDSLLATSEPLNISASPATSVIFAGGNPPSPMASSPSLETFFEDKSSEATEEPENEQKPTTESEVTEKNNENQTESVSEAQETHSETLKMSDSRQSIHDEKEVEEVELAKGLLQELEQSKNEASPPENDADNVQPEEMSTIFALDSVSTVETTSTVLETVIDESAVEDAMAVAAGAAAMAEAQGASSIVVEEIAKEAYNDALEVNATTVEAKTSTVTTTTVIPDEQLSIVSASQQRVDKSASTLPTTLADLHIEMSLCAKQLLNMKNQGSREESERIFAENIISQTQFKTNPELLFSTDVLFKINDKIYPWSIAGPVVMSLLLYGQPLDPSVIEQLEKKATEKLQKQESKGWRSWLGYGWLSRSRGRSNSIQPSPSPTILPVGDDTKVVAVATTDGATLVTTATTQTTYTIKSLRPTSEELASLSLRSGENKITFTVSSELRGQQQVMSTIYLWDPDSKIVISDIDGTITKSDVFGQLMPMLGRDWSHSGVAKLYHNIKENGYHILYLTSRAIGQAGLTRTYLYGLKQGDVTLPPGPVFMSPTRLLNSFNREVIRRKPEEFKIACLKDIRKVFPEDSRPFYAGFGNRQTDAISYRAVDIPDGKIFIINPLGEIRIVNNTYKKTYTSLYEMVNEMFPSGSKHTLEEYNDFNYWKVPLPPLEDI
eukprot:TRINITY_DN722_c0_g1_i1.p1 TRINITY_DN722_c0_g1~~TRINITY_DN722_c0_g1_i1.p1  ORF type:complete len:1004 (-),score=227.64 TRINITY_DN722_c0_g1_i1:70-3081(-)